MWLHAKPAPRPPGRYVFYGGDVNVLTRVELEGRLRAEDFKVDAAGGVIGCDELSQWGGAGVN